MISVRGTASRDEQRQPKLVSANCGNGEEATGGGWTTDGAGNNDVTPTINSSYVTMDRADGRRSAAAPPHLVRDRDDDLHRSDLIASAQN